jgi:hypothetical protein
MASLTDPLPSSPTVTAQTIVQVPEEIIKLFYRLRQLPNTLVLLELNERGEPISLMPLARLERFAQTK